MCVGFSRDSPETPADILGAVYLTKHNLCRPLVEQDTELLERGMKYGRNENQRYKLNKEYVRNRYGAVCLVVWTSLPMSEICRRSKDSFLLGHVGCDVDPLNFAAGQSLSFDTRAACGPLA